MAMKKLITKELERAFEKYPLYSQEKAGRDALVLAKFFHPCSRFTLYVTEASRTEDGDWRFFGWLQSPLGDDCDEYGYTLLSELEEIEVMHLRVERDLWLKPCEHKIGEFMPSDEPEGGVDLAAANLAVPEAVPAPEPASPPPEGGIDLAAATAMPPEPVPVPEPAVPVPAGSVDLAAAGAAPLEAPGRSATKVEAYIKRLAEQGRANRN